MHEPPQRPVPPQFEQYGRILVIMNGLLLSIIFGFSSVNPSDLFLLEIIYFIFYVIA